jgi:hypothetical protein
MECRERNGDDKKAYDKAGKYNMVKFGKAQDEWYVQAQKRGVPAQDQDLMPSPTRMMPVIQTTSQGSPYT